MESIFGNHEAAISKEDLIKHNLEQAIRACIEEFDRKKEVLLVQVNESYYPRLKERLSEKYKENIIFVSLHGKADLRDIRNLNHGKKILVYDISKKMHLFNLEKEERKPYSHVNMDWFLYLDNLHIK